MLVRPLKVTFLLVLALATGFSGSQCASNQSDYADALLVHPRAKDIKFSKYEGSDQLHYQVVETFPAAGIIGWLSNKLGENGWEPLTHDFLNPHLSPSDVKRWTDFVDATGPTQYIVHQWGGDWKDRSDNIVRYVLRYTYPRGGTPNLTDLEVSAVYIPALLAKHVLEEVRKYEKKAD